MLGKEEDMVPLPTVSHKIFFLCWLKVGDKMRGRQNSLKKVNFTEAKRNEWLNYVK